MTKTQALRDLSAPHAPKHPASDTRHGMTRSDDYAWMRAANWQEMFKDPSRLDAEIRAHLEAHKRVQRLAVGWMAWTE